MVGVTSQGSARRLNHVRRYFDGVQPKPRERLNTKNIEDARHRDNHSPLPTQGKEYENGRPERYK